MEKQQSVDWLYMKYKSEKKMLFSDMRKSKTRKN